MAGKNPFKKLSDYWSFFFYIKISSRPLSSNVYLLCPCIEDFPRKKRLRTRQWTFVRCMTVYVCIFYTYVSPEKYAAQWISLKINLLAYTAFRRPLQGFYHRRRPPKHSLEYIRVNYAEPTAWTFTLIRLEKI